ncbi:hypothetical protein FRC00_006879, partial [Tulasnella sp. 408]
MGITIPKRNIILPGATGIRCALFKASNKVPEVLWRIYGGAVLPLTLVKSGVLLRLGDNTDKFEVREKAESRECFKKLANYIREEMEFG